MQKKLSRIRPKQWAAMIAALRCDRVTRNKVVCLVWWDWCANDTASNIVSDMYHRIRRLSVPMPRRVYKALRRLGYSRQRAAKLCVEPAGTSEYDRTAQDRSRTEAGQKQDRSRASAARAHAAHGRRAASHG